MNRKLTTNAGCRVVYREIQIRPIRKCFKADKAGKAYGECVAKALVQVG